MALSYDLTTIRNPMLDLITTRAGASALLRIYDGTRPATGGTPTTLLAELTCNATFAPAASGGVLTLNVITQDSSANNTGTATWFRIVKADGTSFVMDGSIGTSGSDMNMTSTSIVATQPVQVTSFVITEANP
jgi:hypothetical protein